MRSRDLTLAAYQDAAVPFRLRLPGGGLGRPIRVGRTMLTCSLAAAVLNDMRLPPETGSSYTYVNVHNPRGALQFLREGRCWGHAPAVAELPVWGLNWACAVRVCEHLGARLPTVQEWEGFASNNDPARTYPWGSAAPDASLANFGEYVGGPSAVGSYPASDLGLLDLAGNLDEWCQDRGEHNTFERAVKGGAWSKDAHLLAIGSRRSKWARLGTTTIGLRPVWED